MLDMAHKLYFPKLKLYQAGFAKPISKNFRHSKAYVLDWGAFEKRKRDQFFKNNSDKKYASPLPSRYEEVFSNLVFMLDYRYLNEIHHCCRQARMEWERSRGFDTCVRDFCLTPVDAYIRVAFYLLNDCIIDVKTGQFERGWIKRIADSVLTYRFWRGQTGDGLLWEKSGLQEKMGILQAKQHEEVWGKDKCDDSESSAYRKCLYEMEFHNTYLLQVNQKLRTTNIPNIEPTIEGGGLPGGHAWEGSKWEPVFKDKNIQKLLAAHEQLEAAQRQIDEIKSELKTSGINKFLKSGKGKKKHSSSCQDSSE